MTLITRQQNFFNTIEISHCSEYVGMKTHVIIIYVRTYIEAMQLTYHRHWLFTKLLSAYQLLGTYVPYSALVKFSKTSQ